MHSHIVNFPFPFLSSNVSGPLYGVYIWQLIRYERCCSYYDDFRYRHKHLVDRFLSQGYMALQLEKSFKEMHGRYQDLIEKYQGSVKEMVNDLFPHCQFSFFPFPSRKNTIWPFVWCIQLAAHKIYKMMTLR